MPDTPRSAPLPKIFFHVALATFLLFPLGTLVAWLMAFVSATMRVDDPAHRTWSNRLYALVAVDTVLVVLMAFVVAPSLLKGQGAQLGVSKDRPSIGVSLTTSPTNQPQIASVIEGGPAAQGGVEKGDLILEVAGQPVSTVDEARSAVAKATPGEPLELRVSRGGTQIVTKLMPVPRSELQPTSRGLFEPQSQEACLPFQTNPSVPWALLLSAGAIVALHLVARRRGMDATILWVGALFLVASLLTQAATIATCAQVGGPTRGGVLVALYVQTISLIAGGALLWRRLQRSAEQTATATHGSQLTIGLAGALYMLGGAVRIGAALAVVLALLKVEQTPYGDSVVHEIATSGLGVGGGIAFVVVVALLGPIGEELVFRGAVLPWMTRWMRPWTAIIVSGSMFGALHLFYGPFVLLPVYYGFVLGWARLASGGLKVPIALHVAVNGTVSAVLLLMSR